MEDGDIAVIGHDGEKEDLDAPNKVEEEDLRKAPIISDGVDSDQETSQHLGSCDGRVAEIQKGEISQQKIHRGMEGGLTCHQSHYEEVAKYSCAIHNHEDNKQEQLHLWLVGQPQENEFCHCSVILPIHA